MTVMTPNQLKAKISEYDNLNETQIDQLMTVSMKYISPSGQETVPGSSNILVF